METYRATRPHEVIDDDDHHDDAGGGDDVVWMVSGAMFKVPSSQINVIFTPLFRNKLRLNPNKKFKVPIGHRSKSMTKLPTSFAALPTSLVSTKTSKMCVGLAIALGMHAFGDFRNMPLVKQHAGPLSNNTLGSLFTLWRLAAFLTSSTTSGCSSKRNSRGCIRLNCAACSRAMPC